MSYQLTTAEEIRALPEGAVVDTGINKRIKTHESDEFDFVLDADEVLAEGGGVVTVMSVGGPPQPKPEFEELPVDALTAIAASAATEVQGHVKNSHEALADFRAALDEKVANMGVPTPSAYDDHDSDERQNPELPLEMFVLSIHTTSGSLAEAMVPLIQYGIPDEGIARQIGQAIQQLIDANKVFAPLELVVQVHPIRPFVALPMVPVEGHPEQIAVDLGAILQELLS